MSNPLMPGDENYGYLSDASEPSSNWGQYFADKLGSLGNAVTQSFDAPNVGNYDKLGIPMTAQNTYAFDDAVGGRPQAPEGQSWLQNAWDTAGGWADSIAERADTNLGKGIIGGGGALLTYYLQKKKLQDIENARRRGMSEQDARRAAQMAGSAPQVFEQNRQAVGRGNWGAANPNAFANNSLSSMTLKAAEGGSVQHFEGGGQPNMMGFLRYLANGRQIPDTPEERMAKRVAALRAQETAPVQPAAMDTTNAIAESLRNRGGEGYGEDDKRRMASGGLAAYVQGGTSGQADKVPAMLSDGEYVMDADVVSALGDGNNAAGAKKLDKMRVGIRTHKRSASPTKIPPKAKKPEAYLKGAK